jgi:hypothetical protein
VGVRADHLIYRVLREPQRLAGLSLREWDTVLRQARRHRLHGRIAALARDLNLLRSLPGPVQPHLEAALILGERHERSALWEVKRVAKALEDVATPIVLLKGAAYTMLGLDTARGRIFGDVDILVYEEALDHCEASLKIHGWEIDEDNAFDEAYFRKWMHELPPMKHQVRHTLLDVHHSILPRTFRTMHNPRLLIDNSRPVMGEHIRVLAPVDMVLHAATHLFISSDFHHAIRDLADLDSLVRQFGEAPDFWNGLISRADELNLRTPCFCGIRYVQRYFGTPVPDGVRETLSQWRPGRLGLNILDMLIMQALDPGPVHEGKRRRDLALLLLSHWPIPSVRAMITPLFWIKRLPLRIRQRKETA